MFLIQVIVGLIAAVMIVTAVVWRIRRRHGTQHVRHFAWPRSWLSPLERHVPIYRRMPMDMRESLQDRMLEFIDGKQWRPGEGLKSVTQEMKVVIAAHACTLLAAHDATSGFREMLTVRVVPGSSAPATAAGRESLLAGEGSSATVTVVWDPAARTAQDMRDFDNPDIAEAITRLAGTGADLRRLFGVRPDGGFLPGEPLFRHSAWARAACDAWRLAQTTDPSAGSGDDQPEEDPILPAGEDEFVVATEMFYQAPAELLRRQPATYRSLRAFYRMDPALWRPSA